jgi:hypothetical protein
VYVLFDYFMRKLDDARLLDIELVKLNHTRRNKKVGKDIIDKIIDRFFF